MSPPAACCRAIRSDCSSRMERATSGGAVGAILAWPLWNYLGPVLGTIIVFALTALSILMNAILPGEFGYDFFLLTMRWMPYILRVDFDGDRPVGHEMLAYIEK